jgi:hypothetical protein
MKMDTTTWILLAVLALMLWEMEKKKAAAASGSLSGGYLPGRAGAGGAAGASGLSGLLQQLLGGTGNTQKPSAGISLGASSATSPISVQPTKLKLPAWLLPPANQVSLAPNPPLTSTIASLPPAVWQSPEMDFLGVTPIATIPSDTSNIFLTPDAPPSWDNPVMNTNVTTTFVDDQGNTINIPTDFSGVTDQTYDPTAFSPVDTQTIDTDTLGGIAYLPDTPTTDLPTTIDSGWGDAPGGGLQNDTYTWDTTGGSSYED